jgi:DNA-binding NarL/FixJ family response regulator
MIHILLFSSEPLLQLAVSKVVDDQFPPGIALLVSVSSLADLAPAVEAQQPDVIFVKPLDGADRNVLRAIRELSPLAKVVLWTNCVQPELAFELLEIGLRGVLRTDVTPELFLKCVQKVHEGELWFEKAFTDSILCGRKVKLSKRENDLVQLLTQGLKNKEIAWSLNISEGTVKVYLSKLFAKTGAKDRLELALLGLKHLEPLGANPAVSERRSLFLHAGTAASKGASSSASGQAPPNWDNRPRLVS